MPVKKIHELLSRNTLSKTSRKYDIFNQRHTRTISALKFDWESDENFDVEGVKQEEFDALRNDYFDYDRGSEFYFAGKMQNSCYNAQLLK